jgi:enoyl-CoA hydratase/carnithine racemase
MLLERTPVVATRRTGEVSVVTINRTNRRNALTREARETLTTVLGDLGRDETVRAVVLTGQDAAFSAGQDLEEARDFEPGHIAQWIDEHMQLYSAVLAYPRPMIAAVQGCCVGAGLQTALLCDLRIGSTESFFLMPEIDDAIPCILGVWTLWDVIGRARTAEMVLTNRRVEASEALQWGLVNQIVEPEELLDRAVELALQLASKSALAYRLTKERIALLLHQESEALAVHATYAHTRAFASGQPRQAMQLFLDKGRP